MSGRWRVHDPPIFLQQRMVKTAGLTATARADGRGLSKDAEKVSSIVGRANAMVGSALQVLVDTRLMEAESK